MSVLSEERYSTGFTWSDYMLDIQKNRERFQENYDEFELKSDDADYFSSYVTPLKVLILGEDWCGDVVQSLPPIIRILECSSVDYRIFKRDENPDIMDRYLTDGSKSIPYLIFMDESMSELGTWGPRPESCQRIMRDNKGVIPMDDIYPQLRAWYKEHGNRPLTAEMRAILDRLSR